MARSDSSPKSMAVMLPNLRSANPLGTGMLTRRVDLALLFISWWSCLSMCHTVTSDCKASLLWAVQARAAGPDRAITAAGLLETQGTDQPAGGQKYFVLAVLLRDVIVYILARQGWTIWLQLLTPTVEKTHALSRLQACCLQREVITPDKLLKRGISKLRYAILAECMSILQASVHRFRAPGRFY